MKLRTRLFVGLVGVALTFAVAGYLVANAQRRFLTDQVDQQLVGAVPFAMGLLYGDGPFGAPVDGRPPPASGTDVGSPAPMSDRVGRLSELFVGHLDADGVVTRQFATDLATGEPVVSVADATRSPEAVSTPFTTEGTAGARFRAVTIASRPRGGWDVVALSLEHADDAYRRLLLATGLAALAVLGVIGLTAAWVMRLGVKPINDVADAADAITAGELTRRIDKYPPRTEAGRLSSALNTMLDERQAADDRLRQFVTDASHELRTPLTSIRGYGDLYRRGGLTDPSSLDDAMRRITAEAQRMGSLVDELLLLAKLDQHREIRSQPIDIASILEGVGSDARVVDPTRAITVECASPLAVTGDSERLQQAIGALVHNALVHTPAGTPIEVRGARGSHDVTIEVVDHGPGIDLDRQAHVFERFIRGDPSRSRHTGGSGLGLSIAKSIVELHDGQISVVSTPNAGCIFRIVLPARTRVPVSPESAEAGPSA